MLQAREAKGVAHSRGLMATVTRVANRVIVHPNAVPGKAKVVLLPTERAQVANREARVPVVVALSFRAHATTAANGATRARTAGRKEVVASRARSLVARA